MAARRALCSPHLKLVAIVAIGSRLVTRTRAVLARARDQELGDAEGDAPKAESSSNLAHNSWTLMLCPSKLANSGDHLIYTRFTVYHLYYITCFEMARDLQLDNHPIQVPIYGRARWTFFFKQQERHIQGSGVADSKKKRFLLSVDPILEVSTKTAASKLRNTFHICVWPSYI